jgi:hypothetical protein
MNAIAVLICIQHSLSYAPHYARRQAGRVPLKIKLLTAK